jgi:hypothetical protein
MYLHFFTACSKLIQKKAITSKELDWFFKTYINFFEDFEGKLRFFKKNYHLEIKKFRVVCNKVF